MRERIATVGKSRVPRFVAILLLGLVLGWISSKSLLDRSWIEVGTDVLPYVFICIAMLRIPSIVTRIVERMMNYERSVGEDPDVPLIDQDGDGPSALAL